MTNKFARRFVMGRIVIIRLRDRYVGDEALTCETQNALDREIYDAKDNPDDSRLGLAHRFGGAARHGCGT